MASGAEREIVTDPIHRFALSPDGKWLAVTASALIRPDYGAKDPRLLAIPTSGGPARQLSALVNSNSQAVAWSRDSRFILVAISKEDGKIPNDGGKVREIWQFPLDGSEGTNTGIRWSGQIRQIDVSPDGHQLALSTEQTSQTTTWVLQNLTPQREK